MPASALDLTKIEALPKAGPAPTHSGLALVSIYAILCLSLEVEILEHLDSFSRFMSYREILMDSGVLLLGTLASGVIWWLIVRALLALTSFSPRTKHRTREWAWALWLSVPSVYLTLDLFRACRIQFSAEWNPKLSVVLLFSLALSILFFALFARIGHPILHRFCRNTLAPIGYLHILLAVVALGFLLSKGVRPFRDYATPPKAVALTAHPDVYLITLDAARADDMSVYGYRLPTTPNLELFSKQSSRFDNFVANSNFTTSTTTSIETGKLPWSSRLMHLFGFLHQSRDQTLAAALRKQGYYTAMISSNNLASPLQHGTLQNYDAVLYPRALGAYGVWRYFAFVGTNSQGTLSISILGHLALIGCYVDMMISGDRYPFPGEDVFGRAHTIIEETQGKQPLFLWTHILPPHDPYWPPPNFRGRFLPSEKLKAYTDPTSFDRHVLPRGTTATVQHARYDEMMLYADESVGEFLDWLERTGRFDRSIVIVSADHGESFEHDWYTHTGPYLYTELIHIPLLIHLPGQTQGNRVGDLTQQVDLLPTILDLIGAPPVSWTDGSSIKPALQGRPMATRYVFTMNLEPNRVFDPITKGTVAIMDDEFKYVRYLQPHLEALYRYKIDKMEEHDLIASEPEVADRMRKALAAKLEDVNANFATRPAKLK
jgi:arylsulfatase A-like enzyme